MGERNRIGENVLRQMRTGVELVVDFGARGGIIDANYFDTAGRARKVRERTIKALIGSGQLRVSYGVKDERKKIRTVFVINEFL